MNAENNKLIDEFLGREPKRIAYKDNFGEVVWEDKVPNDYDRSWDDLIPAVQKCLDLSQDNNEVYDMLRDAVATLDIKTVYETTLTFIKND